MMHKFVIATGLLVALGACGGGGGDGDERDYADVEREALNLASELIALEISPVASLPTSGTASYEGFVGFAVPGYAVIGDMNMGVNFASGAMSGSARNFVDSDNVKYSGALSIDGGSIDRFADPDLDYQMTANIGGVLSDSDASYLVDGELFGDFLGNNQEGVAGIVEGTVSSPALGTAFLDGEFAARRN